MPKKNAREIKEKSSQTLIEESLESIQNWEPHVRAFLEVFEDSARAQAKKADANKEQGKLHGLPVAIKDLILTTEGHTTAASKILETFESPYDATVIKRLKAAGAIIVGKTNLDEFAMGSSNEYSAFGPVKNPWDMSRVAGGSSGGSAVAVATGEAWAALGTDTGGSVRLPASFCNVVGLKPTYGRNSRFGVIAYASSFDQVGIFSRTVKDNALLLEILAGQDEYDATTAREPVGDYTGACQKGVKGLTIGLPKEFFGKDVEPEIAETVSGAVKQLEKLGARLQEVSLPLMHAAVPTYYLLVKAEASSNLARFDALRYGKLPVQAKNLLEHYLESRGKYFGSEVKRAILMGTYTLSAGYVDAWYKQASRVRTLIRREFESLFEQVDVIAGPVSPEGVFPLGSKADDPLKMYLADLLADPASVAGLPALSVPAGFSNSLPVGMQLIAPHFREDLLFQAAYAYEQSQDWWQKVPEIPRTE
ncbi:MAG: Asp-tRNA(Asn)/Glu-tRNA(Gln) amidotransferase subunit GatA [Patescibacteria group bacterium]